MFFNVSPLGPAGEPEKSRFFARFDLDRAGVENPSFCQRARLVGVPYSTEGSFYSYPTLSVDSPRCLGVKRREGRKQIAKVRRRSGGDLPYKSVENPTQPFWVFI